MNYTKYTPERLLLGLKRSKGGKLLEKKFAMSYFRQDPSLTSLLSGRTADRQENRTGGQTNGQREA